MRSTDRRSATPKRLLLVSLFVLVTTAAAGAVGFHAHPDGRANSAQPLVIADADAALPSEDMRDIASYADSLAVVSVTAESSLPMTSEEQAAGEGYVPRVLTLNLDNIVWSRQGTELPPTTIRISIDGWSAKKDDRVPLRLEGEPDLTVGSKYVLPLVQLEKDTASAGWTVYSPDTIFYLDQGRLSLDSLAKGQPQDNLIRTPFLGSTPDTLASALKSVVPYTASKNLQGLNPVERYRSVERS